MTISGGTLTTASGGNVWVWVRDNGTLTVSGNAVLNLGGQMWIGRAYDSQNLTGTLNMNGGTVTQSGIYFVVGQPVPPVRHL